MKTILMLSVLLLAGCAADPPDSEPYTGDLPDTLVGRSDALIDWSMATSTGRVLFSERLATETDTLYITVPADSPIAGVVVQTERVEDE